MIRLGTVFSGIGSIEQALLRSGLDHQIVFACDNGDVELKLFDKEKQKEYDSLRTLVGKKSISQEQLAKLQALEAEERELVENLQERIFALHDKRAKKAFVDQLYLEHSSKHNFVKKTYDANYEVSPDDFHLDIRFLDATDYRNQVDL